MKNDQPRLQTNLTREVSPNKAGETFESNTLLIENEALRHGFTLIPNYVLRDPTVSFGARMTYTLLLSYAWQEGSCFPGQTRLARDLGVTRKAVSHYLSQLRQKGFVSWKRRGMGKTNVYYILDYKPKTKANVTTGLHQDVTTRSHPDVPRRLHKEDSLEKDTEEKDSDHSKFRKGKTLEKYRKNRPLQEDFGKEAIHIPERRNPALTDRSTSKIAHLLEHLSKRELHDPTHIKSNITRAVNYWRQSSLAEAEFLELIREARKITLARSGSIKKKAENYMGLKNHAPYFFQVLQDLIRRHVVTQFRKDFSLHKSFA